MNNGLSVFIGVMSDEKTTTGTIVDRLFEIKGVSEAFELTGSLDILVKAKSDSVTNLNKIVEQVRATDGVKSTSTYLILEERR
ncbi:MAG TPA: Lrp/AsnC ligand binding domain-containing protein [Candidatus Bilamarchaeaceae archaeon]|nr:Lrp/AsnC ligand binding domain-containing protein [Candidatus Bilamarchaeaceae archaeon]